MARLPTFLEAQTTNYWLASRELFRSDAGVSSKVAAQYLASLARHCCHDRLRSASVGALVSLGLSDVEFERADVALLAVDPIVEGRGGQQGYDVS